MAGVFEHYFFLLHLRHKFRVYEVAQPIQVYHLLDELVFANLPRRHLKLLKLCVVNAARVNFYRFHPLLKRHLLQLLVHLHVPHLLLSNFLREPL